MRADSYSENGSAAWYVMERSTTRQLWGGDGKRARIAVAKNSKGTEKKLKDFWQRNVR